MKSTSTRHTSHWKTGADASVPPTDIVPDCASSRPHFGQGENFTGESIRALTLKPHWAAEILAGRKRLEIRSRPTRHRGPLALCTSARPKVASLPNGHAVCIVQVTGCRPFTRADVAAAGGVLWQPGLYAWELADIQPLAHPFPVKGQLSMFTVTIPTGARASTAASA